MYITPIWMLIGDDDDMVIFRLQELPGQHLCHRTRDHKGPMTASDRFDGSWSDFWKFLAPWHDMMYGSQGVKCKGHDEISWNFNLCHCLQLNEALRPTQTCRMFDPKDRWCPQPLEPDMCFRFVSTCYMYTRSISCGLKVPWTCACIIPVWLGDRNWCVEAIWTWFNASIFEDVFKRLQIVESARQYEEEVVSSARPSASSALVSFAHSTCVVCM